MSVIDIDIDVKQLENIVLDLGGTEKQVRQALNSALSKMALWLRGQAVAGLSKELGIKREILRQRRLKIKPIVRSAHGGKVKVFFGLDPISYTYLGIPKKVARGVMVGKYFIEGGFAAKAKNGQIIIFKREGRARLPIKKQSLDVKDKSDTYIEHRLFSGDKFMERLFLIFEHELKWRQSKP